MRVLHAIADLLRAASAGCVAPPCPGMRSGPLFCLYRLHGPCVPVATTGTQGFLAALQASCDNGNQLVQMLWSASWTGTGQGLERSVRRTISSWETNEDPGCCAPLPAQNRHRSSPEQAETSIFKRSSISHNSNTWTHFRSHPGALASGDCSRGWLVSSRRDGKPCPLVLVSTWSWT